MVQIVNLQLKIAIQHIQHYKDLITEFEKKNVFCHEIYQQGYSDSKGSKKPWKQQKLINMSNLFAPHYHPAPMDQSSSPSKALPFKRYAPNFYLQSTWYNGNASRKDAD